MKRKIILFCLLLLVKSNYSKSQSTDFVKIAGNRFVHEDETPFHPMVMNYKLSYVLWDNEFVITQDQGYRSHGFETPYGINNWKTDIEEDIDYIQNMGFNSIRVGIYPHLNWYNPPNNDGGSPTLNNSLIEEGWYFNLSIPQPNGNISQEIFYIDPLNLNDPNFQKYLSTYDQFLEYVHNASPDMKVIFILFGQQRMRLDLPYWQSATEYVRRVPEHLSQSEYADMVLGLDIVNEPCYHIDLPGENKKEVACSLISQFNNAIKSADSRFLTTIGTCGDGDFQVFDPLNMAVDYLSYHIYPDFGSGENRYTPNIQQKIKTKCANKLLWFQKHVSKPWIIGETGFCASERADRPNVYNLYPQQEVMHGSPEEQKEFLEFMLKESYLAGSAGFSWWEFQDTQHGYSNDFGNYWGILEKGYTTDPQNGAPAPFLEKHQITNIFRQYIPGISTSTNLPFSGNLSSDYQSEYNQNSLYYNPNGHMGNQYNCPDENGNTYPLNNIEGYLVNPTLFQYLKDFPIEVSTIVGRVQVQEDDQSTLDFNEAKFVNKKSNYITYSDNNGYFRIIPGNNEDCLKNDFDDTYHLNRGIEKIVFNFPGGYSSDLFFRYEFDDSNGQIDLLNQYPQLSSAYNHVYYFPEVDSKNKTFNNAILPSVHYVSGENNLIMAEESITVESSDFIPNNESVSFKAGKEILFSGEIDINYGFEMDARNGNIEKTCTGIQVPQQRTSNNNSSENTQFESEESKNIFLQFKIIKENDFGIQIFPQPANDYLRYTIDQLPNSTNKAFEIKIHDMLGKELYSGISIANSDIISLYAIAPGFYFIQFKFDDLNANTIKFIKL